LEPNSGRKRRRKKSETPDGKIKNLNEDPLWYRRKKGNNSSTRRAKTT